MSETIPADMGFVVASAAMVLSQGAAANVGGLLGNMTRPNVSMQTLRGIQGPAPPSVSVPMQDAPMHPQDTDAIVDERIPLKGLTHQNRTFMFNRAMVVRVTLEDGVWAFESDDPELTGFGYTRDEAEASFCFSFAFNWDQIAREDDENLMQGAIELKQTLLALVGPWGQG